MGYDFVLDNCGKLRVYLFNNIVRDEKLNSIIEKYAISDSLNSEMSIIDFVFMFIVFVISIMMSMFLNVMIGLFFAAMGFSYIIGAINNREIIKGDDKETIKEKIRNNELGTNRVKELFKDGKKLNGDGVKHIYSNLVSFVGEEKLNEYINTIREEQKELMYAELSDPIFLYYLINEVSFNVIKSKKTMKIFTLTKT